MSRYHGPCGNGARRAIRQDKRNEAEARNAETPFARTKVARLGPVASRMADGRPIYCSECGASNPDGSTVCAGCGRVLNA